MAPWSFTYEENGLAKTIQNITGNTYNLQIAPSATTTVRITSVTDKHCTSALQGIEKTIWITLPINGVRLPPVFAVSNTPTQLLARNIGDNYNMYNWFPVRGLSRYNINDPVFNYDKKVDYQIEMRSEAGCLTTDSLLVQVINSTEPGVIPALFVPKAWTPNGDGRNDILFPFTINISQLRYFRVFNRWGQLVFETKSLGNGWNGMFKGEKQPIDTYTWTAEAIGINGEILQYTGLSALLR